MNGIIASASNIRQGDNPPFSLEDFLEMYPQFKADTSGNYVVPKFMIEKYLKTANACIKENKWHSYWEIGMGLFIAHFCTIYLQGISDPNGGAAGVIEAGKTRGLDTSVSVGDVSVSTDYSITANNIDGWAGWSLTTFGQQLASIGKLKGKGGMLVY